MSTPSANRGRAEPDALVALVPVAWQRDQVDILSDVHPDIWGEPLRRIDAPAAQARFRIGDCDEPVALYVDEALPELTEMVATAKQPFHSSEIIQLENHGAIWRLVLPGVSTDPIVRSTAFARLVATAIEAGAPAVFFPFCLQLHSPGLVKHLAIDFGQPPALVNLYVNAWNDDEWMVTRGLTVFGFPELETPVDSGLNDAYFRLMDVAAGLITRRDSYPDGARLQLGPHLYTVTRGPSGPDDSMVPICGSYGRLTIRRPD